MNHRKVLTFKKKKRRARQSTLTQRKDTDHGLLAGIDNVAEKAVPVRYKALRKRVE